MVKLQKPIPKKIGIKPKLDNPIKSKKQINKGKPTGAVKNIKPKLLESPIKEAKITSKPIKEVLQKRKDQKNPKGAQKEVVELKPKPVDHVAPQKGEHKGKKSKGKDTVVKNGDTDTKIEKSLPVKSEIVPVAVKSVAPVKNAPSAKVAAQKKGKVNAAKAPAAVKSAAPVKAAAQKKGTVVVPTVTPTPKGSALIQNASEVKDSAPVRVVPQKKDKVAPTATPAPKRLAIPQKGKNKKPVETVVGSTTPAEVDKVAPTVTSAPKRPAIPQKGKNKKSNKKPVETVVGSISPAEELKVEKKSPQSKKKAKIALKKAKKAAKGKPSTDSDKTEKKAKLSTNSIRFDPIPFDEEKFNAIVGVENIKQIAEVLKNLVQKEVANKKSSIFDDYRYFLQVGSFKIANCPKRMVKLTLKHALVDKDDDVLLVVPDLQRGAKVDYEPTIHHYEDLLRSYGVEGITIMPMNQLRKEYSTYEQKRRLCASYDHFLCDGRIVSHVVGIIGKITQKPSHTFHAVRLHEEKDVKAEIEKAMRKTAYRQLAKSSLNAIPLATHKFTSQQIAENVVHVVGQLKNVFPGGLANVRNLHLKIDIVGTSSLPLYISMAQAPEQTPMVVGPREQRMIKLKREANEVLSKFAMTKEGKLIKLTRTEVEKKRQLQEMKAALKEDEELPSKKAKKDKKASEVPTEKKKEEEVKELELPENEEDDDNSSDEDEDNDAAQLESSSDDDDEMGQVDQEEEDESTEEECETGIVENGLGDEESDEEEEDQQGTDGSDDDDDGDEDDNDGEEAEESD